MAVVTQAPDLPELLGADFASTDLWLAWDTSANKFKRMTRDQVWIALQGALGTLLGFWVEKTADHTAVPGEKIAANTSAGGFTVTLPPSPVYGDWVDIDDPTGDWPAHNLIVAPNSGQTIDGVTGNLPCDASAPLRFQWYGGPAWKIRFTA